MLIFLILNIVNACEYDKILECLQKGSYNTECVNKEGCVLIKVERIISSHQLKITGFIIEPLFYTQMAAHSKCDLKTFDSCFIDQDSIGVLDCVTQKFCIEYVNIEHLSENIEEVSESTQSLRESENKTQELTELYREQVTKKLENLFEKVKEGLNEENSEELLEKLEKINEELDVVEKELETNQELPIVSPKTDSDLTTSTDSQPHNISTSITSSADSNTQNKSPQYPDLSTEMLKTNLKPATTCSEDCDQLCDSKKTPSLCISNCLTEFCQSAQSPSSDYLSVLLTGMALFLIVFVLFLFLQNKSMRTAIENGEFGIAIYSSI